MPRQSSRDAPRDYAEMLAVQGLTFLAQDPDRLGQFLALTGIDPQSLRKVARQPDFLTGVLDHILADERLLLDFAASCDLDPAQIAKARMIMGDVWERDIP